MGYAVTTGVKEPVISCNKLKLTSLMIVIYQAEQISN